MKRQKTMGRQPSRRRSGLRNPLDTAMNRAIHRGPGIAARAKVASSPPWPIAEKFAILFGDGSEFFGGHLPFIFPLKWRAASVFTRTPGRGVVLPSWPSRRGDREPPMALRVCRFWGIDGLDNVHRGVEEDPIVVNRMSFTTCSGTPRLNASSRATFRAASRVTA
jgi:hypothetical protein